MVGSIYAGHTSSAENVRVYKTKHIVCIQGECDEVFRVRLSDWPKLRDKIEAVVSERKVIKDEVVAHAERPDERSTTVTTADVAENLNKWNIDGKERPFLPEFNPKIHVASEPDVSLSLLVIDFGESCVVKVEKNTTPDWFIPVIGQVESIATGIGKISIMRLPFTELRAALDADDENPVPEVYLCPTLSGQMQIHCVGAGAMPYNSVVKAICERLGDPLPIYSPNAGTWTQIPESVENRDDWMRARWAQEVLPFKVYRYTRAK